MQQPYETNYECNYRSQVRLDEKEIRLLRFWKTIYMAPIAILSLVTLILLTAQYANGNFTEYRSNMVLLLVLPIILALSVYNIFNKELYKEIFDSEVTDHIGVVFINYIYLKDKIGRISPLPFTYRADKIKNGKRYRIHKLQKKNIVLKIEEI